MSLRSWDELFVALFSHNDAKSRDASQILSDDFPKSILKSLFPSFPPPTASSKALFDSAVSTLPHSSNALYDNETLKEDALWLSKKVKVGEQECLRLALLEWQQRPELRLQYGYSEAEQASLREALGSDYVARHIRAHGDFTAGDDAVFNSKTSRRARLMCLYLNQQVAALRLGKELTDTSLLPINEDPDDLRPCGALAIQLRSIHSQLHDDIEVGMIDIQTQLQNLESEFEWETEGPDLENLGDTRDLAALQVIEKILEILLLRVGRPATDSTVDSVRPWFEFMSDVGFFVSFNSHIPPQAEAIQNIKSTASLITLRLLNIGSAVTTLSQTAASNRPFTLGSRPEYFFDSDCVSRVHEILVNQAAVGNSLAGPAILAWAVIFNHIKDLALAIKENAESQHVQSTLETAVASGPTSGRRPTSHGAGFQITLFQDLLDAILLQTPHDNPASFLLGAAIDRCNVVECIAVLNASAGPLNKMLPLYKHQALQELIAVAQSFLGYTPELVSAQLALLAPTQQQRSTKPLHDAAAAFIEDWDLRQGFYDVAAARFPYECLPFLRFSRALATAAIFSDDGVQYVEHRLRSLTSFTQVVIKGISIRTTREDETGSFVSLNKSVNLLDLSQQKLLTYTHQESGSDSIIPADTIGELISDPDAANPKVVRWQFQFSGLAYLAQLLELHYFGLLTTSLSPLEETEPVVSEIIRLIAAILSTMMDKAPPNPSRNVQQHCLALLDEVSAHLNSEADVATYVFDILEQELQSFRRRAISTFDCRIMTACVEFIVVLTKIQPHVVWSNLNRISLLGHQPASSPIFAIVSGVEVPLRVFDFLEECTLLYQIIVSMALRYADVNAAPMALPPSWRIQSPMLVNATESMCQVLQGISEWAFQSPGQQRRIASHIADSFSDIMHYAFGVGTSMESPNIVTGAFVDSATYLAAVFRKSIPQEMGLDPIARLLFTFSSSIHPSLPLDDGLVRVILSIESLATILVRYSVMQNAALSSFEKNMFDSVPCVIRILLLESSICGPTFRLLRAVIDSAERHQPSSLLAHLGSATCLDLLNFLRHLDHKAMSPGDRAGLWRFLTLLLRDSQQWLAMVVLTARVPNGSKGSKSESKSVRRKTFLQTALGDLQTIEDLPHTVAIAMLQFVLQAQQNWSWVTNDLSSSETFFPKMVHFVTTSRAQSHDETDLANTNIIAALVTDIATTHLHHAKISKNMGAVKTYIPLIDWLSLHAVHVSSYNASLHSNLRRNFSAKYTGLAVADIKNTGLSEQEYGSNFFYDMEFADAMLGSDAAWRAARGRSHNQSFSAEFCRANTNLSVVDSELALLSSLQRLCVDHCKFFAQDREVQKTMARIVQSCLQANSQTYPAEALFESLFQTRADLSTALLRELVTVGAKGSDFVGLLGHAWTAARFRSGSYEQAIINDDLPYWRTMLSVLLMTIQFHVKKKQRAVANGGDTAIASLDPENSTYLEITANIVAEGFKSIIVALQDQNEKKLKTTADDSVDLVGVRDISILATIFQVILRLPSLPQFSADLSDRLSSSGILSSCLVLYSWSHLLNGPESDKSPGYADYCVKLLVSLSSLPPVAEEIAVEGVLNRLLSTKTTEMLQRIPSGASHADNRPNCAFFYRLWATGLLPLCLNLLHAVGGVLAPEISAFLNQFPDQMVRASTAMMPKPPTKASGTDVLTLTVASEAATLALLSYGLSSFRDAGASAAVDSTTILPLKGYDEHRNAIVEDLRDLLAMNEQARRKITVPIDEKELSWQNLSGDDQLDSKIVRELRIAVAALSRDVDDDEK